MLDQFFLTLNAWMVSSFGIALVGSFLWGVVSVLFSPCHLASIPLVVAYVAGQNKMMEGKEAAGYAGLFSIGLFISIALVGIACALLGRMLGDISPLWGIPVGLLFLYLGLDLMGVAKCRLPSAKGALQLRGYSGALILGLSYGILSGACTFGFIAPLLAIVTVQEKIMHGIALLLLFGLGHCLPIALAGSSTALAQRLVADKGIQHISSWGRKVAGLIVVCIGLYFAVSPFVSPNAGL
ncbi:cytochrome c biogenesis protein CcdA [Desulfovibrio cuneatus]|uniref:cytochrome c biogenesis CcdA family protein n=1 Tax=Desulfovibrio cuneatus TaxID=159728 RepID=UPI000411F568